MKQHDSMTDDEIIEHAKGLNATEAALDLDWIETLRTIHKRKLYLAHGYSRFHEFCTQVLDMSDDSAWRRMKTASLADRFPDIVKPLIAEKKVHLTGLALLERVITPENGERLIQEAAGKSTTEIKAIIAREQPEDCMSGVRKVPTKQIAEDTWRFQARMKAEAKALLTEAQDLANEDDCDAILLEALKAYCEKLRVQKQKALRRPAKPDAASMRQKHDSDSRDIPRPMERDVRERDRHQCTFIGHGGHRCGARRDLQVHHIIAVALGGKTVPENLTLHCGVHNRYQAELDLGTEVANRWRKAG